MILQGSSRAHIEAFAWARSDPLASVRNGSARSFRSPTRTPRSRISTSDKRTMSTRRDRGRPHRGSPFQQGRPSPPRGRRPTDVAPLPPSRIDARPLPADGGERLIRQSRVGGWLAALRLGWVGFGPTAFGQEAKDQDTAHCLPVWHIHPHRIAPIDHMPRSITCLLSQNANWTSKSVKHGRRQPLMSHLLHPVFLLHEDEENRMEQ